MYEIRHARAHKQACRTPPHPRSEVVRSNPV